MNKRDHTRLICDIGELTGLFSQSTDLNSFLQRIVDMIAEHMRSDVCSIYLYYPEKQELILKATKGLNADYINQVSLKLGEGLTGLCLKELRPICEQEASRNISFRYFPGLGEENYESFLAVPINRGATMVGAMVIQNTKRNYFNNEDIRALRAVTSQLANIIEMAKLFLSMHERQERRIRKTKKALNLKRIEGKSGSSGTIIGPACVLTEERRLRKYLKKWKKIDQYTLEDFRRAVVDTEKELELLQSQIEKKLSDVASLIFTAQILMLKDQSFLNEIESLIEKKQNPPQAIVHVVEAYVKRFEELPTQYLREKSHDVLDIGKRLLECLMGENIQAFHSPGSIVIARDILPSEALKLSIQNIKGFIVLHGGVTSHLSILAQTLSIPLIIADEAALMQLRPSDVLLMDADLGYIYVNPDDEILASYEDRLHDSSTEELDDVYVEAKTFSKDKQRITLMANVNLLDDLKKAKSFKAEGVGLYRTEFPFMVRSDFPNEEEQFVIYRQVVDQMKNKEVTFRTLDIGGDKVLSYFDDHFKEPNPYLGLRSIRFSLRNLEIFTQQLRAILRAGYETNLRIMFPMISSLDELLQAKMVVQSCIEELRQESVLCHRRPKIGIMIEVPSVLEIIDDLAKEVDFFSIGTNDFIQYMLGVDRTNEKVSEMYLPHHPSILRGLKRIVDAATRHKIDVSICGDMAHDLKYLNYFIGIGLKKLSVNPNYIPKIQKYIQSLDVKRNQKYITTLLQKSRLVDIEQLMAEQQKTLDDVSF